MLAARRRASERSAESGSRTGSDSTQRAPAGRRAEKIRDGNASPAHRRAARPFTWALAWGGRPDPGITHGHGGADGPDVVLAVGAVLLPPAVDVDARAVGEDRIGSGSAQEHARTSRSCAPPLAFVSAFGWVAPRRAGQGRFASCLAWRPHPTPTRVGRVACRDHLGPAGRRAEPTGPRATGARWLDAPRRRARRGRCRAGHTSPQCLD